MKEKPIKIQKNIPIPENRGRVNKYPWKDMKVGDSFLAPAKANSLRQVAQVGGKVNKMKFVVRQEGKKARCWRVK